MSEHACACSVNCHASSSSPFCAHMLPLRTHAAQRRTHTHTHPYRHYIDPSTKISPKATAAAAAADDRDNPQVASGSKNRLPNFQLYTQTHTYNKKAATPTPKKKKTHQHSGNTPKKKNRMPAKSGHPFRAFPGSGPACGNHTKEMPAHTLTHTTQHTEHTMKNESPSPSQLALPRLAQSRRRAARGNDNE